VATDLPKLTGRSIRGDLADGLRYIRTSPGLLGVLLLGAVPGVFLMGPFSVTIVLFVQDVFEASNKYVGIIWGCFGGGIVLGSMLLTLVRTKRRGWLLCVSVLAGGVLATIYGAGSSLPMAMVALVVFGITGPAVFINFGVALLQEHVSREMMGRVMSMGGPGVQRFDASGVPAGRAGGERLRPTGNGGFERDHRSGHRVAGDVAAAPGAPS
jgi:hypothetical protein